jgi:hypothetical protein
MIAALCYVQPLVRSWSRCRTRLFGYSPPVRPPQETEAGPVCQLPRNGRHAVAYWSPSGMGRTTLLERLITALDEHHWGKIIDEGWSEWDVEVYCHPWTALRVCTAQEEYGGGRRLIRIRYHIRPNGSARVLKAAALIGLSAAAFLQAWPAVAGGVVLCAVGFMTRRPGAANAARVVGLVDAIARGMQMTPLDPAGLPLAWDTGRGPAGRVAGRDLQAT